MTTVSDICARAMRKIGALAAGETMAGEDSADVFAELNSMIGAWRIESLMIYAYAMNVFNLVASQGTYTIGTGGNFNVPRPNKLLTAKIRIPNQVDLPIAILNQQQFSDIVLKNTPSQFPFAMVWDGAYPLRNITVWPIPNVSTAQLLLWLDTNISAFTSLDQTITLPDGYEDALVYNLAVRIAPEYGKNLPQIVAAMAMSSKANVKRENFVPREMGFPDGLPHGELPYNFYVGPFV